MPSTSSRKPTYTTHEIIPIHNLAPPHHHPHHRHGPRNHSTAPTSSPTGEHPSKPTTSTSTNTARLRHPQQNPRTKSLSTKPTTTHLGEASQPPGTERSCCRAVWMRTSIATVARSATKSHTSAPWNTDGRTKTSARTSERFASGERVSLAHALMLGTARARRNGRGWMEYARIWSGAGCEEVRRETRSVRHRSKEEVI